MRSTWRAGQGVGHPKGGGEVGVQGGVEGHHLEQLRRVQRASAGGVHCTIGTVRTLRYVRYRAKTIENLKNDEYSRTQTQATLFLGTNLSPFFTGA